jgi:hypothetical protein
MVVAAREKAWKLPTDETAVVAFESGYMHTTSRIWADIVARGEVALELCLPDHIAAILVYWQDARTQQPVWPLLVWNACFVGDRDDGELVQRALGARDVDGIKGLAT